MIFPLIRRIFYAKYIILLPFSHHNMVGTVEYFGMQQLIVQDRRRREGSLHL